MDEPVEADLSGLHVRSVQGYEAVADVLRREIYLGRIKAGQRLPPERKLAEQLGVARETLRQALRVLEGSGQIAITRGARGGRFVQDPGPAAQTLILAELRDRMPSLVDLTEFRAVVESGAAALAAKHRTDDDLDIMRAAQDDLRQSTTTAQARHADTAFHLAVAAASGNKLLARSIEDARIQMFALTDMLTYEFVIETSWHGHNAVIAAIRGGETEAAAATMRRHIEKTRGELADLVDTSPPS